MAADFSQLPEDVLDKIVTHHVEATLADHVTFAAACKSWRSVALLPDNRRRRVRPGILVSPTSSRDDVTPSNTPRRHYYFPDLQRTPSDCEEYSAAAAATLDNVGTTRKCQLASNDGWLLLEGPTRGCHGLTKSRLYLLNPLTGEKVDLPEFRRRLPPIRKAILSGSPDGDDDDPCFVFLFFDSSTPQLGWCEVGGGRESSGWMFAGEIFNNASVVDAASYSGGELYVLAGDVVYVLDNSTGQGPTLKAEAPFSRAMKARSSRYLCHVDGQLHVILLPLLVHKTTFQVYKLSQNDVVEGGRNWERVRSLNGHAVFIGTHQCFSIPASDGSSSSIMKDCIYFVLSGCPDFVTVDDDGGPDWSRYDCGVFSVGDEINRWTGFTDDRYDSVWFFPMPWKISEHKKRNKESLREGSSKKTKDDHDGVVWRAESTPHWKCGNNDHYYDH